MIGTGYRTDARLANDAQLLAHRTELALDGTAAGTRVCSVQPAGGLHLRVLLDRGMDIGAAWYAGQPIAWVSPSGERPRGYGDEREGWHRGWAGGLLTTCGLLHIGPPAVTGGRHGSYSELPTEGFTVKPVADNTALELRGHLCDTDGLDRGLVLERVIRVHAGSGVVEVIDITTNQRPEAVRAPILYHVNLGYPFLTENSRTTVDNLTSGAGFTPEMGPPANVVDEVSLHRRTDQGEAVVRVSSELGFDLQVSWDSAQLPMAYTWRRRVPGCYVHAIEPTTAYLEQSDDDPWPLLEPGEARETGVRLAAVPPRSMGRSVEGA